MSTMRAVRCHRFAAFSAPAVEDGITTTKPQLLKDFLPLRSVLSLDEVERPALANRDKGVLIQTHYAGNKLFIFAKERNYALLSRFVLNLICGISLFPPPPMLVLVDPSFSSFRCTVPRCLTSTGFIPR